MDSIPTDPDAHGESLRIRGHVHRANCDLDTAELVYRRALEHSRAINSLALEGKAKTNLAETLCWLHPTQAIALADDAINFNSAIGNQLEVLKAYTAKAVAASDLAQAEPAVTEAIRLARVCQYRAGEIFALVGRLFQQVIVADPESLVTASQIYNLSNTLGVYLYWNHIARWWLLAAGLRGEPGAEEIGPSPDWLGLPEDAQRRWNYVLEIRKCSHA